MFGSMRPVFRFRPTRMNRIISASVVIAITLFSSPIAHARNRIKVHPIPEKLLKVQEEHPLEKSLRKIEAGKERESRVKECRRLQGVERRSCLTKLNEEDLGDVKYVRKSTVERKSARLFRAQQEKIRERCASLVGAEKRACQLDNADLELETHEDVD